MIKLLKRIINNFLHEAIRGDYIRTPVKASVWPGHDDEDRDIIIGKSATTYGSRPARMTGLYSKNIGSSEAPMHIPSGEVFPDHLEGEEDEVEKAFALAKTGDYSGLKKLIRVHREL